MFEIRYLEKNEKKFLEKMLYESIYIEETEKPPMNELLNAAEIKKYHHDWGKKGDQALIAVDCKGTLVGAVWFRLFNNKERGYGFVNDKTPELGIAVVSEARGKGLGTKLMRAIIEESKRNGYNALSLSVDEENRHAVKLYQRLGFVVVKKEGNSITMILRD